MADCTYAPDAGLKEKGVPIRAFCRSVAVLQALNAHGDLTMNQIAEQARIPYATAIRIVQTLIHEGLVVRNDARLCYRTTALVLALSHGYNMPRRMAAAARPHISQLTEETGWPVTVTSRVGPRMVIGESTHMLTPFIFNLYQPGYSFPILECSSGRAYLAFAEDKERAIIIEALQKEPELVGKDLLDAFCSGKLLDEIRRHGYAVKERNRYTENPGKTSSISVPIWGEGQLLGAAALTFFSSALRLKDAIAKFVPALIKTAEAIDISITAQSAPDLRRA